MQYVGRLLLSWLVVAPVLGAQVREQPPLYSGPSVQVPGVFVPPIPGVPFTATVMIQSKQPLADGSVETRIAQEMVARDSRGRIRNERHAMVSEGFKGESPLVGAHIFDPATRISYMMTPLTMIAREQLVPPPRNMAGTGDGKSEDLGYTTLNGLQAKGTRISREVPAP